MYGNVLRLERLPTGRKRDIALHGRNVRQFANRLAIPDLRRKYRCHGRRKILVRQRPRSEFRRDVQMAWVPIGIRPRAIAKFVSARLSRRTPSSAFGLSAERGVLTSHRRDVRLESRRVIQWNLQDISRKFDLFDVGDVFGTEPFNVVFEPFGGNDVLLEGAHLRCQFDVQGKRSMELYHRGGGRRKRQFNLRNGRRNGYRSLSVGRDLPGRRRFGNLRRMFEFGRLFGIRRLPKRFRQFRNE